MSLLVIHPWRVAPASLHLAVTQLHLWQIELTATPMVLALAKSLLAPEEYQRGERFVREDLRQRYWMAHAWKRCILAKYSQCEPLALQFTLGVHGKPYVETSVQACVSERLQFNLSHSRDKMLLIVARGQEVGVDIEYINAHIEALALAKRFFAAQEYEQLKSLPVSQLLSAFYRIWTLKEAVVKALGQGLYYPLSNFEVRSMPDFQPSLQCLPGYHVDNEAVFSWEIDSQHMAAVAAFTRFDTCYCWKIDDFATLLC